MGDGPDAETHHVLFDTGPDGAALTRNIRALSLDAQVRALERIVLNPKYHDVLTLVKGVRNGIVYGTKIRFPHALVMMFLFRSGSYVCPPPLPRSHNSPLHWR